MTTIATIRVPATTANLGAGFDCIGAALSLYNEFILTTIDTDSLVVAVRGLEAAKVNIDESNLAYQAFLKLYARIDRQPPVIQLEIELGVPLARGLGSSATAIVGGLLGANAIAGSPLSATEVMELAIEMEGHPDNVVPALIGGCRVAATARDGWAIADIPWHSSIVPVVAIPNFELSTSTARSVLPTEYSRADAIFNAAHLGLTIRGLETGNADWLTGGISRSHPPALPSKTHSWLYRCRTRRNYCWRLWDGYQRCRADIASLNYHRTCIGSCGCYVSSLGNP